MSITVVKDVLAADAITHGGRFHADDVLATAILSKIIPELKVARVYRAPYNVAQNTIVYDIGCGAFDHHQPKGNGKRENGVPYASAGLIWRKFGFNVCVNTTDPQSVWQYVDRYLIQGIDAADNGVMPKTKYPAQPMNVSQIVDGFNVQWCDDPEATDENGLTASDCAFLQAVSMVDSILSNTIKYADTRAKATLAVREAIQQSKGGVLVLNQYMPWKNVLFESADEKTDSIKVVVYPEKRNGYVWCVVPSRATAPEQWRGLTGTALQKRTGCKSATFVHSAGFMGGAKNINDALSMAQCVVKQSSAEST